MRDLRWRVDRVQALLGGRAGASHGLGLVQRVALGVLVVPL